MGKRCSFKRFKEMYRSTSRDKGFGLLETLVAMAIIGAVAAAFLIGNSAAFNIVGRAMVNSRSIRIAQLKMEDIKLNQPYQETFDPTYEDTAGTDYSGPGYSGYSTMVEVDPLLGSPAGIQKITVRVFLYGDEKFDLSDYKGDR